MPANRNSDTSRSAVSSQRNTAAELPPSQPPRHVALAPGEFEVHSQRPQPQPVIQRIPWQSRKQRKAAIRKNKRKLARLANHAAKSNTATKSPPPLPPRDKSIELEPGQFEPHKAAYLETTASEKLKARLTELEVKDRRYTRDNGFNRDMKKLKERFIALRESDTPEEKKAWQRRAEIDAANKAKRKAANLRKRQIVPSTVDSAHHALVKLKKYTEKLGRGYFGFFVDKRQVRLAEKTFRKIAYNRADFNSGKLVKELHPASEALLEKLNISLPKPNRLKERSGNCIASAHPSGPRR